MKKPVIILFTLLFSIHIFSFGQRSSSLYQIKDLVIRIDTLSYSLSKNTINYQGHSYFSFAYTEKDPICELIFVPNPEAKIAAINLLKSSDYIQVDSLVFVNHEYYRTKIKFINLNKSQLLSLMVEMSFEGVERAITHELKLMPYTKTSTFFAPNVDELYIGEEKVFELITSNIDNIRVSNEWNTDQDISYRINQVNGQLQLHLLPNNLGTKTVNIKLRTYSPNITEKKEVIFDLPTITQTFKIKASRLAYLTIDKKDITYEDEARTKGVEIQIDNHRQLVLGKTYRVENQEQPGGPLIAEIFTKTSLANDRVLCIFRPYNLHRQSEGYLYIKDGDAPKFITNLNITPKLTINIVSVMHQGQDWNTNLTVNPGEIVDVKLEGESFDKARFHWEDVVDITSDTLIRNENLYNFRLKIPMLVNKKRISLFNNVTNTGIALGVREYQIPRNFDYITLNYGNGNRILSSLTPTIIQRSTIKDITISFDNLKIDSDNKLFGKQYVDVDIKLLNKRSELTEVKSIKNLVLCPGDNSPRAAYYKDKSCTNSSVSLNTLLGNKTYNMDDFARVQLEFKNESDKYSDPIYTKQVDIVLQRKASLDLDVSFPTGLLIQNIGNSQNKTAFTDNLGGISLALIVQVSFPDQEKVGAIKPFRLGAGFLAINAFNFSTGASRDLAAVAIGSFYPIRPGKVFSLPIHFGFGYKFQEVTPFIMLSPGIGISF